MRDRVFHVKQWVMMVVVLGGCLETGAPITAMPPAEAREQPQDAAGRAGAVSVGVLRDLSVTDVSEAQRWPLVVPCDHECGDDGCFCYQGECYKFCFGR